MTASADDRRPGPPADPAGGELAALVDDGGDATRLTVYPADAEGDQLLSSWITVDADAAVPLADAR